MSMGCDELFMKFLEVSIAADSSCYPDKARDIICTATILVPFIRVSPEELADKAGEFYEWIARFHGEIRKRPEWVEFKDRG